MLDLRHALTGIGISLADTKVLVDFVADGTLSRESAEALAHDARSLGATAASLLKSAPMRERAVASYAHTYGVPVAEAQALIACTSQTSI